MSKTPNYVLNYRTFVWYDFIIYKKKIVCEDCIRTQKVFERNNKHIHCVKTVLDFPKNCSICGVKIFWRQPIGKCF